MKGIMIAAASAALLALPFAAFAQTTHTVTIDAYVDGQPATAASASSASFPMTSWWGAANIGSGSGTYPLGTTGFNSPNPYEAVTSAMSTGGHYTTNETISGNGAGTTPVGKTCAATKPFVLVGYSMGSSLAAAAAAGPSAAQPNVTNLTSDQFMIVWNRHCITAPVNSNVPKNGATVTSAALTKLDWSDVSDPWGTVSYIYEASNSPALNADGSFVSPVFQSGALSASEIPTPGTPPGLYYFHEKAVDSVGNSSAWGQMNKVIVSNPVIVPLAI